MKIKSREEGSRRVGDEGVFDFNGVSYDDAVTTLYRWYFSEGSYDGPADEECDGDIPAEDDCIGECCYEGDCGGIIAYDECEDCDDGPANNLITLEFSYAPVKPLEYVTLKAYVDQQVMPPDDIKEKVDAVQHGMMSPEQLFKAMGWL